jgi:hypothetical protein
VLLPALGDPGLTHEQRAQILKRYSLRWNDKQDRANSDRGDFSPPTPKRYCSPLAHAARNALASPWRRVATMRLIFLWSD